MNDLREKLRGEATVYASRDFEPWQIIGAYTGRVMTNAVRFFACYHASDSAALPNTALSAASALATLCQELATESKSLLMLNKRNDYIFAMKTRVTINGDEEQLLAWPHGHISLEVAPQLAVHSHSDRGQRALCCSYAAQEECLGRFEL